MSYYMLLRDYSANDSSHQAGTLWQTYEKPTTQLHGVIVGLVRADSKGGNLLIRVPVSHVMSLLWEEYEALSAVKSLEDRVRVAITPEWREEATSIGVGQKVEINMPEMEVMAGVVKYKGVLPGRDGRWFGVELNPAFRGKGSTDGTWRKHSYFRCEDNSGMFLSILRIHKLAEPAKSDTASSLIASEYGVNINDRVVYITEETGQMEYGTARYIGTLPDGQETIYVGVEFDNKIGKGNGKYKGRQLFTTPKDYASLIPLMGLMKAEDMGAPVPPYPRHTEIDDDLLTNPSVVSSTIQSGDFNYPTQSQAISQQMRAAPQLKLGDMVEVLNPPRYGKIRWIGYRPDDIEQRRQIAGIEMEISDQGLYTDGVLEGVRMFSCRQYHAFFIYLDKLRADSRYDVGNKLSNLVLQSDTSDDSSINHSIDDLSLGISSMSPFATSNLC